MVTLTSPSKVNMSLQNFGEYNLWLAAENGMFLRSTNGKWMTTMPEHLNMDWVASVKVCKPHYLSRYVNFYLDHL